MKKPKSKPGLGKWLRDDITRSVLNSFFADAGEPVPTDLELVQRPMPDPVSFTCSESFRTAYWLAESWSKFPFEVGIDRENAAHVAFLEAERRCADANQRLADLWTRPIPEGIRSVLSRARSLMAHLFDGFSVEEVIESARWGPGASTSLPRAQASPQNKWVLASHITADALPYLLAFSKWCGREFPPVTIVEGNKVVTVPKNAKTDRAIAIEPDWNMFFQLGLGGAIRRRLQRKFRLLRPNAQQVNGILARIGSETNDLATVDLKGASDTVSLALVDALVPEDVKQHLYALRSPKGTFGDTTVLYEKISSMGNGFTFELETAIFYCLCRAASGHAVVYGDDIVINASSFSWVLEILSFCGFEVNLKKTHTDGPFRESCGKHYFKGVDVTPPYFRKPVIGSQRITCANRLSLLSDNGHWRRSEFYGTWQTLVKGIPRFLYGPKDIDGVVHCDLYSSHPKYSHRYQCFTGTRLVEQAVTRDSSPVGGLLQSLWKHGEDTAWRFTAYESKDRRPIARLGRWMSHWPGISPWAAPD